MTACIQFAPLFTNDRLERWASDRDLYGRGGLTFFPGRKDVPLLVDHNSTQEVGRVHQLVEWDDTDGPWLVARADITDPPAWLKRGTAASFAHKAERRSSFHENWVYGSYVTEVSILSPTVRPAEPLARVVLLEDSVTRSPAAGGSSFDPGTAAGEIIYGGPTLYRPNIGTVTAIY